MTELTPFEPMPKGGDGKALPGAFENRVVLVTGAASGIGWACAHAFAREGASIMLADIDADAVASASYELREEGAHASCVVVDVRDPESCNRMVAETISQFGHLHVAVNNAAVPTRAYVEFEDLDVSDWERAIGVNLTGVFHSMRAEVPALRKSGGRAIVNIASMMSRKASAGQAAYVASKHGVAGLTKAASIDLIRHGIRVNAICPGFVDTPMLAPLLADGAVRQAIEAMIPSGRVGDPEEIASAVLFLASDQASYMVGAMVPVDAGSTL